MWLAWIPNFGQRVNSLNDLGCDGHRWIGKAA
jgi:hypothetical protein